MSKTSNNKLQVIKKFQLDALLVSSLPNIVYLTGFSAFSSAEREAFLLITKKNQYVFTDTRYSEAVKNNIPSFTLIERTSGVLLKTQLQNVLQNENIKKLGFESTNITVEEYEKLLKPLRNLDSVPIPNMFEEIRIQKRSDEITAIEKTCSVADKAYSQILNQVEEGVTEIELAVELEYFIKKQGAEISFRPIVAFSGNSALPHHKVTNKKLKKKDVVLLDFGAKVNNYCSDMTRTIFFGQPDKKFVDMYKTVLEAQTKAINFLKSSILNHKSGIKALEVDKAARDYIISHGYPSIPHSVGHGIGIEVHEAPSISPKSQDRLVHGMVFSVEPGIYFPGFGGVRIEDLVVIENNKIRSLTKSPKTLTIL